MKVANNEDMCRVMNEDEIEKLKCEIGKLWKTNYELETKVERLNMQNNALTCALRSLLDAYNARCDR